LYGEVAAYVAQNTYLLLYKPNIREYSEESSPPGTIEAVYRIAREIVRNYELNGRKGYGAHISGQDIDELAHPINYVPGSYADIAWDEKAISDGTGTESFPIRDIIGNPYDDDDAREADIQKMLRTTHVTYENYPYSEDEIFGLITLFLNSPSTKRIAVVAKLTRIFQTIEKEVADKLAARLRFRVPSDKLSLRFNDAIPIGIKTDLLEHVAP
jgi:hypothetical protein